jgi:hypothetical protein
MTQALPGAAAEACASFSFRAQSSQQTSTALPPIVIVMKPESSSQSHAAQVFSVMPSSTEHFEGFEMHAVEHAGRERRFQDL